MTVKQPKTMKGVSSIERNGSTYWYARTATGKTYCGEGDKGRNMAEAARAKYIGKRYEQKEVRAGLKVKKQEFRTVTDLCNWYMQTPRIQEQKGYTRKCSAAANLLRHIGKKPITGIEGEEQERYRQARQLEGAAPATINLEVSLLSAMFHQARKWKKITSEVMPGQFVIRDARTPRRLVTDEEYQALLETASVDFRDVLVCAWESAMRSSEIGNLQAGQVHLNEDRNSGGKKVVVDYIDLGVFDNKNKTRRTVPVSARLKEILERRLVGLDPEDRVFRNEGREFTAGSISHLFRRACKRAKVVWGDKARNKKNERAGIVFHCLRHTRTTKWVEMGYSDEIIRRATGHLNLEAYRTYVKLDPSAVMRLVVSDNSGIKTAESLANKG